MEYIQDKDEFLAGYAKSSNEDLWMNSTFYTFTNFVTNNKKDDILKKAAVLDLACGEGLFTRWAATEGAARVVGVDISEGQIAIARELSSKSNSKDGGSSCCNIEYIAKDAADLDPSLHGQFDVAFAVHLFCYAENSDMLNRMLKSAAACLKKGGVFYGVRECLDSSMRGPAVPKCRGELAENGLMFSGELLSPQTDFSICKIGFRNSDGSTFNFVTYPVFESTMIKAFQANGFEVNFTGPILTCSQKARELFPKEFLRILVEEWGKLMWYFKVTKL